MAQQITVIACYTEVDDMFKKWTKRRELKKVQEECFHEYHIVSTYEIDIREWYYSPDRLVTHHDMYCPICDKTVYSMSDISAKRALERQKVRNEYKESH